MTASSRLLMLAAIGLALSPASAREPMSTAQMKELSPPEADARTRQDLLSILEPLKEEIYSHRRALGDYTFYTRPYGTEYDGVCRRELLTMRYATIDANKRVEDRKIRPYKLEVESYFHIDHLPHDASETTDNKDLWPSYCNKRTDKYADWFNASDAFSAVRLALVLKMAIDELRAGKIALDCSALGADWKDRCKSAVFPDEPWMKIAFASSCDADGHMLHCHVSLVGVPFALGISATENGKEAPTSIKSVTAGFDIIVT